MTSVMISIRPQWVEKILNGEKTIEIRKTAPKLQTPFKCYIYETQGRTETPWIDEEGHMIFRGRGMVIGEFVCDFIAKYDSELWDDFTFERIREIYEPEDFAEYGEYEYRTIADNGDDFWKDNALCKAACLSIEELRKYIGTGINEFYSWHISDLKAYDQPKKLIEFEIECKGGCDIPFLYRHPCENCNKNKLTRPPQSWCYVERMVDNA